MILLYITIGLFIFYSILILFYRAGWRQLKPFSQIDQKSSIKVSVIIPARNEEENIGNLLSSLEKQTYPAHLFEVIVVDDHSTDNTAAMVNGYSFSGKILKYELYLNRHR